MNARVAHNQAERIFYKEFLPRGPLESVKAWIRGSRADRARAENDKLRAAGFNAPENIAWGSLPKGRQYLFSTAVAGSGVTQWLGKELAAGQAETLHLRRALLSQLGEFVGRLHAAGFIHGDLRTSNVLADRDGDTFSFSLIDNERNIQCQPAAGRNVLRNLMQLNMLVPSVVSNTDRMRFFVQWRLQMHDLNDAETKLLAREAWSWAMRRLRAKGKV